MLKKVIPMFLALCMIIGSTAAFGTGYEVSDGFTAASATSNNILTCTDTVYVDTGDEITPEMEEAYFRLLDKMSRENEAAAGKTAFNEVTYD